MTELSNGNNDSDKVRSPFKSDSPEPAPALKEKEQDIELKLSGEEEKLKTEDARQTENQSEPAGVNNEATDDQSNQAFPSIGENYLITELIGRGGMGSVYKATDNKTGNTVAVKILDKRLLDDPVALIRFMQEIESA